MPEQIVNFYSSHLKQIVVHECEVSKFNLETYHLDSRDRALYMLACRWAVAYGNAYRFCMASSRP